ncbi:MAG: DNA primase, partial [Lentisphaeria bacterium]|nr:DNA primase [Lentisphaeria bacterium]
EVVGSYVRLQKRGADYWACCPFHKEKTPSFKVSSSRQSYYCFGCHKSGNVFSFVQEIENIDFPAAVELLARRAGVILPQPEATDPGDREAAAQRRSEREAALQLLEQMARWYQHMLAGPEGKPARDYIQSRGLDPQYVSQFQLGYSPESWDAGLRWVEQLGYSREQAVRVGLAVVSDEANGRCYDRFRGRLMFPIHDAQGRVVGFSGRVLAGDAKTAKYVNTPETDFFHKGRLLYGFHLARPHFREHGGALVCEGQLDVIACHRAGLNHAVSAQGTAFTEHHAQLLRRHADRVLLAFDADAAGRKAALGTILLVRRAGMNVSVLPLPAGEDPDSLYRSGGPEALRQALESAVDAIAFAFEMAAAAQDRGTPQGKSAIVAEVLPAVTAGEDPVARAAYCRWLAEQLEVPEAAVQQAMAAHLRREGAGGAFRDSSPRAGSGAPRGPAATVLPAFRMRERRGQALSALLDLALHFESVARELCDELPPELVPDLPLGRALNLVLAATAQGEWSHGADKITADQELIARAEIARALMEPRFAGLDPTPFEGDRRIETEKRLHEAAADCIAVLRQDDIDGRLKTLRRAMAEASGEESDRLLAEFQDLQRRKRELGRRNRGALEPDSLPAET